MSDKETGFSQNLTDIVSVLNKELLKQGRLSTDPYMLNFHSYDCVNLETGEPIQVLNGHINLINAIAISQDEQTLVSGGEDCNIHVWSVP